MRRPLRAWRGAERTVAWTEVQKNPGAPVMPSGVCISQCVPPAFLCFPSQSQEEIQLPKAAPGFCSTSNAAPEKQAVSLPLLGEGPGTKALWLCLGCLDSCKPISAVMVIERPMSQAGTPAHPWRPQQSRTLKGDGRKVPQGESGSSHKGHPPSSFT